MKQLGSILKTNVRACKAVGHPFVIQLGRIYLDMLNVYKCLSENISAAIQANGKHDKVSDYDASVTPFGHGDNFYLLFYFSFCR